MSTNVTCSIVTPTYQRKDALYLTLLALSNQDYPAQMYEVVVVDDGSTDGTLEMLKSLKVPYRIRYHYAERGDESGRCRARNIGINLSEGQFIIFIDSDILVKNNFISEHMRYHNYSSKLCVTGMRRFLSPGEIDKEAIRSGFTESDLPPIKKEDSRRSIYELFSDNMNELSAPWHFGFSNNLSVSQKSILEAGYFDENFKAWGLEDCEFSYRLYRNGVRFAFNRNLTVYHQYHEQSPLEARWNGWENNLRYFCQKHPYPEVHLQNIFCKVFNPNHPPTHWRTCCVEFMEAVEKLRGRRSPNPIQLTIIFLVYNAKTVLEKILAQISKHQEVSRKCEIVVVDEGSDDTDIMIQCKDVPYPLKYYSIQFLRDYGYENTDNFLTQIGRGHKSVLYKNIHDFSMHEVIELMSEL